MINGSALSCCECPDRASNDIRELYRSRDVVYVLWFSTPNQRVDHERSGEGDGEASPLTCAHMQGCLGRLKQPCG